MVKDLIRISKEIIYDYPFYGTVLLTLQKEFTTKVPTAGVGLNGLNVKLYINPEFWASLSDEHKTGLLIHELGHVVNFHLTEYRHLTNKEVANIAMDLYINQHIKSELLPEGGCTCDKFNLPLGKDTNWYYKELMQDCANNKAISKSVQNGDSNIELPGGDIAEMPNHQWDEVQASEASQKMISKQLAHVLGEVAKNLEKSNPGSVPGSVKDWLEKLNTIEPPKFNWKAFVRRFINVSTETWSNKTRRKKSKRFTGMPGLKEMYYSNILVAIDTSLSVSIPDLKEFQNELYHLHKTGHSIEIILVDTQIHSQFKYNPKIPLLIEGRGGTYFQPVIDYYRSNLKKYSCLIYLTDGEASIPENARGNILWVHGTNHELNENLPGKSIKLNLN